MARGVFIVQIASQQTGTLSSVRVEASSRSEAVRRVADLGENVVDCSLAELLDASDTAVAVPASPLNDANIAATDRSGVQPPGNWDGVYVCPQCGAYEWISSRRFLFWAAMLVLFPVGLFLFRIPQAWQCRQCGYFFRSPRRPAGMRVRHSIPSRIAAGLVVCQLVVFFVCAVAAGVLGTLVFFGVDIQFP